MPSHNIDTMTLHELVQYTSDYYKDAYGYRPVFVNNRDPEDLKGDCINLIDEIDEYLDRMAEADDTRDRLTDNGWIL